jgi:PPOX class probable F420-dependent enzyme
VRRDLSVEQLGDLVDLPLLSVLATYRRDGSVLQSPIWHEWHDGAFVFAVNSGDVKMRHMQRDPRACIVVAENGGTYRGIEVSGTPEIDADPAHALEVFRRIAIRYLGPDRGEKFASDSGENLTIVTLRPGRLRTWDFVDDPILSVLNG